jgi:hypothetical protein
MARFFSHPRFLLVYSATLTVVFVATTAFNLWRAPQRVLGSEQHHVDFDQLTVHRINIIEPDGTPRLVISDKAEFPGGFYMGKEFTRADDRAEAGMLFMNDEGTENGGMLFGGYKDAKGQLHSNGHLSFDGYEQDQTMSLESDQDGDERATAYQINDNIGDTLFTQEFISKVTAIHAMPDGPEKQKALADFFAKHPYDLRQRAALGRDPDKSAVLRLRDPEGHTRILLRVAADGTPSMQFLNVSGKITHQWPENPVRAQPTK